MKNFVSKIAFISVLLGVFLQAGNVWHSVPEDTGLIAGGEFNSHTVYVKNESLIIVNIPDNIVNFIEEIYLYKYSQKMSDQKKIFSTMKNISTEMIFNIENNEISTTYFIKVRVKEELIPIGTEIVISTQVGKRMSVGRVIDIQESPMYTFEDLIEGMDFRRPDLINDYNISIEIGDNGFIDIYNNEIETDFYLNDIQISRTGIFPVKENDILTIKIPDLQVIGKVGSQLYMQFKPLENNSFENDNSELIHSLLEEIHMLYVNYDNTDFVDAVLRLSLYVREFGVDGDGFEILSESLLDIENPNNSKVFGYDGEALINVFIKKPYIEISVENTDDLDINADRDGVKVAKIKLDAEDSEDNIEIKNLKLKMTVDSDSATINNITNCELFNGGNVVSSKEDASILMNFYVLAEVYKYTEDDFSLKCDIGDDFENGDMVTISGVSFEAEGVMSDIAIADEIEGQASVEIADGEMILSLSSDDVNDDRVVGVNKNSVSLGIYELKAKNNSFTIDEIGIEFKNYISNIIDGYVKIYVNGLEVGSKEIGYDSTTLIFININTDISKDEAIQIEFKINSENAGNIQINSLTVEAEEDVEVEIETDGPLVRVVEALPVVTKVDMDRNSLETGNDVKIFTYKVRADGGDIPLGKNVFNTRVENVLLDNTRVVVYNNASMTGTPELEKYVSMNNGSIYVDLSSVIVNEDDTYYVSIVSDITATDDTRSIQVELQDKEFYWNGSTGRGFMFGDIDGSLLLEGDMRSVLTGGLNATTVTEEEIAAMLVSTIYLPMLL